MYSYRLTVIFFIALCSIISLLLLLLKSLLRPNCLPGCDLFFSPVFFKIFWSLVFWSFTTISFSYIFNSLLSSGSFQTIYEHVFLSFILKNKTKENLLLTLSPHRQPNFLSPNASKLSKICLYFLSKISLQSSLNSLYAGFPPSFYQNCPLQLNKDLCTFLNPRQILNSHCSWPICPIWHGQSCLPPTMWLQKNHWFSFYQKKKKVSSPLSLLVPSLLPDFLILGSLRAQSLVHISIYICFLIGLS